MLANLLRRREDRSVFPSLSQAGYLAQLERFAFSGNQYMAGALDARTAEFVTTNPALAAVIGFRVSVFAEATFKFQQWIGGRPGNLYGNPDLQILESPWPGAGTSHLLAAMETDISVYGNSYWIRAAGQLVRLDPTAVTIATSEVVDDATGMVVGQSLIGYGYRPANRKEMAIYPASEVAHFRLVPDPVNPFRGVSWLRAVLADADADSKMTGYKQALLDNSAVPGLVLRAEPGISQEQFTEAREALRARNTGWDKVGRTLMLGAGFDVRVVGSTMQQLDMKALQGAGESRIAAAAGVSPVLVGFSEGLQGSSLNTGNYGAARRRFADGTVRPLWRAACTALETLVPPPTGSRLWIDADDVPFLQEDQQDEANIRLTRSQTIRTLVDAGYDPDASAQYADTGDVNLLRGQHSGLFSVQLQPPGSEAARSATIPEPIMLPAAPVMLPSAEMRSPDVHIHLPEPADDTEIREAAEQRQERVIDVLEQISNSLAAMEDRQMQPTDLVAFAAALPAPVVNVSVPDVTVNVPEQPVQLTLEMPAPVINVPPAQVVVMPSEDDDEEEDEPLGPEKKTVKFIRDPQGRLTGATVIEEYGNGA